MNERKAAIITAFLFTTIFFWPFISGAQRPIFALTGDTWGLWLANLPVLKYYFTHGIFNGIDYFTHGGASEMFLRPNLPVYYPPVMLGALLSSALDRPIGMVPVLMWIYALHALIGTYCLHRLCARYLGFDDMLASFIAVGYAFSMYIVQSAWFVPEVITVWLVPVAAYLGMKASQRLTIFTALYGSIPIFMLLMDGYAPLAIMGLAVAAGIIAFFHFVLLGKGLLWKERAISVAHGAVPFILGGLVALPFFLAMVQFNHTVGSPDSDINYSAHALAEPARYILRSFAASLHFDGPIYEVYVFWGLVPLAILVLFVAQHRSDLLRPERRNMLLSSIGIYLVFMLAVFGAASVISDLFYYFLPVIGYMHIYQRYMCVAQLFFMIAAALMLDAVLLSGSYRKLAKIASAILAVATIVVAFFVFNVNLTKGIKLNPEITDGLVIELFVALLFMLALALFERRVVLAMATFAMFMVPLQGFYRHAIEGIGEADRIASQQMSFNPTLTLQLADFMRNSTPKKAVVKYFETEPDLRGFIPENLPWFVAGRTMLSSYYGYEVHLAAAGDYRAKNLLVLAEDGKSWTKRPDWDYLRETGADYIIYDQTERYNDPQIAKYVDLSNAARVAHFKSPDGLTMTIAPLKLPPPTDNNIAFDNGYVRLTAKEGRAGLSDFSTNNATRMSMALESEKGAALHYLFWRNRHLKFTIDGKQVDTEIVNELMTLQVPAGKHMVKIAYCNLPLMAFQWLYALYALAIILSPLLAWWMARKAAKAKAVTPA